MSTDNDSTTFQTIARKFLLLAAIFGPIVWSFIFFNIFGAIGTTMVVITVIQIEFGFDFFKKMMTFLYLFTLLACCIHYHRSEIGKWLPISIGIVGVCVAGYRIWSLPQTIEDNDEADLD